MSSPYINFGFSLGSNGEWSYCSEICEKLYDATWENIQTPLIYIQMHRKFKGRTENSCTYLYQPSFMAHIHRCADVSFVCFSLPGGIFSSVYTCTWVIKYILVILAPIIWCFSGLKQTFILKLLRKSSKHYKFKILILNFWQIWRRVISGTESRTKNIACISLYDKFFMMVWQSPKTQKWYSIFSVSQISIFIGH